MVFRQEECCNVAGRIVCGNLFGRKTREGTALPSVESTELYNCAVPVNIEWFAAAHAQSVAQENCDTAFLYSPSFPF